MRRSFGLASARIEQDAKELRAKLDAKGRSCYRVTSRKGSSGTSTRWRQPATRSTSCRSWSSTTRTGTLLPRRSGCQTKEAKMGENDWTTVTVAGHRIRYRPVEQLANAPGKVEIENGQGDWVSVEASLAIMFAAGMAAERARWSEEIDG